jgi:hypothetical protein
VVSGACQTFWEFKQWVAEQNEGALVQDGSVTRLSSYVVNYLKYLVSEFYSPVMDKVLKIDQNWRGQEQSEEQGLAYGVLLFMQALELQVERRSREFSDPALRHIFMMNNLWYMRTRARRCELGPLLGETWLTEQRQKVIKILGSFRDFILQVSFMAGFKMVICGIRFQFHHFSHAKDKVLPPIFFINPLQKWNNFCSVNYVRSLIIQVSKEKSSLVAT